MQQTAKLTDKVGGSIAGKIRTGRYILKTGNRPYPYAGGRVQLPSLSDIARAQPVDIRRWRGYDSAQAQGITR